MHQQTEMTENIQDDHRKRETIDFPVLHSIQDVQQIIGASRSKIMRLIDGGSLRAIRIGKSIKVPDESLRHLLTVGSGSRQVSK